MSRTTIHEGDKVKVITIDEKFNESSKKYLQSLYLNREGIVGNIYLDQSQSVLMYEVEFHDDELRASFFSHELEKV